LGPEGGRPGRPTQTVRHTCSGNLGIDKILKLHHISKNPPWEKQKKCPNNTGDFLKGVHFI
jgi:hypothetical protein